MLQHRWNSLIVHLGLTVLLSIAVTGAVVLVQVTGSASDELEAGFNRRVHTAAMQVQDHLRSTSDLQLTGAIVLSQQAELVDAVRERDFARLVAIALPLEAATARDAPGIGRQGLTIYDPTGALLLRVHAPVDLRQDGPVALVMETLESAGPSVGIRHDELFGPSISGTARIVDTDGSVLGVVELITGLDDHFASAIAATVGMTVAVLDPAERIATSDPESTVSPTDLINLRATEDPLRIPIDGEDYIAESVPLIGIDDAWIGEIYVGLEYSLVTEAVDEAQRDILRTVLLALAGGLTVAGAVGLVTTRSLRGMMRAAQRIRENDLDTPVPQRGPHELRELATAMDEMRLAVRATREDMTRSNTLLASRADASDASLSSVTAEISVLNSVVSDLMGEGSGGLPGVAEQLTRLEWIDGALIALFNQDGRLVLAAAAGSNEDAPAALVALAQEEAILLGQGVLIDDITAHQRFASLATFRVGAVALVPIATAEGNAGVIGAYASSPTPFTTHSDLLHTVGQEVVSMLQRTELAEEVQENRYLAESVLRSMSDGIVVIDGEGVCHVCNPAAASMLGVDPTDVLGSYASETLPLSAALLQPLHHRIEQRPSQPTSPIVAQIGTRELAISAGPFESTGATAHGMILLIQDLTALGEADRLKQDFVSMIGHELRTPLTMIRSTIALLADDRKDLSDPQVRLVDVLETHSNRLLRLINDLIDMSALDAGQMRVAPVTINLTAALAHVVELQQQRAGAANVSVSLQTGRAITAWADPARIDQVVTNLIQNAIKYTPAGGTITVHATEHADDVRVDVIDTGIGIAADEQPHLFTKFYRAESGRRRSGGTGLGLAISHSIIELHGGEIWCESDGSSGTTFSFTLPRRGGTDGAFGRT